LGLQGNFKIFVGKINKHPGLKSTYKIPSFGSAWWLTDSIGKATADSLLVVVSSTITSALMELKHIIMDASKSIINAIFPLNTAFLWALT